ncbi:MAG: hypothetical protein NTY36_07875 [Deltaproteobacteria bacterium]|nr:hypothetical protein [Deltaproteobacteria bacterium]
MRRRTWLILLTIVVLGGALAGGLYWHWASSPRYALQRMALALKTKDMPQFFNYVDLKAIFNNFIDCAGQDLDEPKAKKDQKEDDWSRLSRQLGNKFTRTLLPKLFESFEKNIRGLMEKYLLNLNNTQILAIAAAATTAQIEVQGEEARVTLVDPKSQEPFHFQMRRQAKTGSWQIVSVNYQDLKKFSKREFQGP